MIPSFDRFEYCAARDLFYDFCLWEYTPLTPPDGKLHSSTLLFHSFDVTGMGGRVFDLIQAIRDGIGVSRTVWGVKKIGDEIRWELYFYDYRRRQRERSVSRLLEVIRPLVPCDLTVSDDLHYFMFSIDLDHRLVAGQKPLDEIHLYIGNPGSAVSSGICYSLTHRGTRLENFYFFFNAAKQQKEIASKAMTSVHLDATRIGLDQIFWPETRQCEVIVVANKQENDAVYFSRIDVDQLLFFLKKMAYPNEIVLFFETQRHQLDHLRFDAGFDYRMQGKDLKILKSGYYGIF